MKTLTHQLHIPLHIQKEIEEKGFCVYNYISFAELFGTVNKDYLSLLSKINIPFGVISILLFALNPLFGIGFLLLGYIGVFLVLVVKLIHRSYYFLLVSDVIFTTKGVILGKEIFKNEENASKTISKYEHLFSEHLGKESKLNEIIFVKRKELLESSKRLSGILLRISRNIRGRNTGGIIVLGFVGIGIYTIFLYVFYYVGYAFGIILFYVFQVFLRLMIYFTKNTELKIKNQTQNIDTNFQTLTKTYGLIQSKIQNFKEGDISNLSGFIEKNFQIFYTHIELSLKNKDILLDTLTHYTHKDLIDFSLVENYIKTHFNKPIYDMIALLEEIQKLLEKQIQEIQALTSEKAELSGSMKQKEITLSHQLDMVISHKIKFKNSLL